MHLVCRDRSGSLSVAPPVVRPSSLSIVEIWEHPIREGATCVSPHFCGFGYKQMFPIATICQSVFLVVEGRFCGHALARSHPRLLDSLVEVLRCAIVCSTLKLGGEFLQCFRWCATWKPRLDAKSAKCRY